MPENKTLDITVEVALKLYREMLRLRRFEEGIAELYYRGLVPSSAHLYIGEEAVATGVCAHLNREDYILTTHRGHAHTLAKGARMDKLAAEILGKATGLCRGKGGSMRVCSFDVGALYACSIVGSNIPIAAGVGLSIKLRSTNQVVACFFGDGASNIGDFHEGLNLASIWKAPVVYICENNMYGLSVSVKKSTSIENIAGRAVSYSMPSVIVDGNDVVAVYKAAEEAIKRARSGNGATLIECKTYRWLGHHAGDPGTAYRTREEVEAWKAKCPIKRLRTRLLRKKIPTGEFERIEMEVREEVEAALRFAEESSYPEPGELMEDIY